MADKFDDITWYRTACGAGGVRVLLRRGEHIDFQIYNPPAGLCEASYLGSCSYCDDCDETVVHLCSDESQVAAMLLNDHTLKFDDDLIEELVSLIDSAC